tara:strand:+ start:17 stop:883 length:867 start_codon:yes stop_codon:yes gene_type:complete
MAVKPITNKQVVDSSNINRGEQVSTRDIKDKAGNSSRTIIPGNNITNNYSITLKDIDSSVLSHVKDIMRPKIREANETVDVTVMYGNEERWKSVRKRGVMRDKNGSLILPLIMLKRTTISKNTLSTQGYDHDLKRKYATVVRSASWSKDNRYDRFSVQTGIKPKHENLVTGIPDYADITYEFILWTNYIEQMNILVEEFIGQSATYWGTSTDMKFLCTMDNITDASEMTQDGERFIKSTFEVTTKSYLLPEYLNSVVSNKVSNLTRELTPSRIVFGFEGDATDKQVGK